MSARPFYLESGADTVFALFHPSGGAGPAVLLVPPLGWDNVSSYRSRRNWAEHLAASGHPTLRIDLPGTGDSSGGPEDPDQVARWTRAVTVGAAWLRGETARRVVAIGFGAGGLLVWLAAAAGATIDDLVLWAAPGSGAVLARRLQALAKLERASNAPTGPPLPQPHGGIAPGGFLITHETLAALGSVNVSAMPLPSVAGRRALLLGADGAAVDAALQGALEGAEVTVAQGNGYEDMLGEPALAKPPLGVFEQVRDWLASAPGEAAVPATERPHVLDVLERDGVREMPLAVDVGERRLIGIVAEPAGRERVDLCVVFLNAGAIPRIGPSRLWVDASRRWARRGVAAVRVDVGGIGDSDGGFDHAAVPDFYVPERIADVRAVLDALEERGLPGRFALAGLCSGAYWAFHTAMDDERVATVAMINPGVLVWSNDVLLRRASHVLLRNALKARDVRILARLARLASSRILARLARPMLQAAGLDRLDRALDRLRARVILVFGEGEPLRAELEREGRLERIARRANVDLVLLEGWDHTLRPEPMRAAATEALDRALAAAVDGDR